MTNINLIFRAVVGGKVRCLAVCRLWRRVLDPRRLPLHAVDLTEVGDYNAGPLLEWVLHKLSLEIPEGEADHYWPAICQFLSLRELSVMFDVSVVLDSGMLRSLPPQLSNLNVSLADVHIEGSGLLPSLTHLKIGFATLEVNAALPSLVVLDTEEVDSLQLVGDQLRLPRLEVMLLHCSDGAVDFGSVPALRELQNWDAGPHALVGLTALPNLEILELSNITSEYLGRTASMLQQAPATLCTLRLAFGEPLVGRQGAEWAAELGPALGRLARLEYFVSNSTAFLPYLRHLPGLRWLELQGLSAADLSIQDVVHLAAGFFRLEKLAFGRRMPSSTAKDLRQALKELTLSMPLSAIQPLWPAVSLFTCLRHLEVRLLKKFGTLDGSWLSSLPPSLEALDLKSLNKVVIPSIGGLLPSLTYLMVGDTGELVIDAVLPSLELLETEEVEITQLAGPRLQLPQLTRLDICSARGSGVDLQRMPSLQVIELWGCPPMAAPGLAALSHLTSLGLCLNETKDAGLALGLLQRVPAQLRHLQLLTCEFLVPDVDEPASQLLPALRRLTQLTSLSTDSTALLPYLAALPRLRCLELQHMSAGQLSIQDADFLAGLRGLQQLTFRGMMPIGEERTRRLQLLAYILPAGNNGITANQTMPLVAAVDFAGVYNDSKTIVDRPLKAAPSQVGSEFAKLNVPDVLQQPANITQYKGQLTTFVDQWTDKASDSEGTDMVSLDINITSPPADWLPNVTDPAIQEWATRLYEIWGDLGRQLSPRVRENPELFTMLYVPNSFVVPGARFREVYYWDSYWVIKGLLVSQLNDIAEHIVDNFAYLIETYGHIPNGIRTYYLNRRQDGERGGGGQPPLFSEMVRIVHEADPNTERLSRALRALLVEHALWTSTEEPWVKQVAVTGSDGKQYNFSRYYADWYAPRPESYKEDVQTAMQAGLDEAGSRQLWHDLASTAESGWDFSSRWFANGMNLTTVQTTKIIPADLNALLFQMETNIARFADELGCSDVATRYRQLAATRSALPLCTLAVEGDWRDAINAVMWDAATSQWRDLILTSDAAPYTVRQSNATAVSNWVPLFAGVADPGSQQATQAVQALQNSGLIGVGGLAATNVTTGQQWDFPNVWPPLVDFAVVGAEEYGGAAGAQLASNLAQTYLQTAFTAFNETGNMFEKYNAQQVGVAGGGGEYEVLAGFGWSNGVALSFLDKYGWQG
ncbi:hypothetical protein N2152v2_004464 [Parachlorella kessleri]